MYSKNYQYYKRTFTTYKNNKLIVKYNKILITKPAKMDFINNFSTFFLNY